MKTALVTGANKGIGFEVAKQLAENGYFVFIGSRNYDSGLAAVEKLKGYHFNNIEAIPLDVTQQSSVTEARRALGEKIQTLDVLVNNAGISGAVPQSALRTPVDVYQTVYATNLLGVVSVTQAFIDLIEKSAEPRIVNVSTSMASLTLAADLSDNASPVRYVVYQSSKAALNMYTVNLAYELRNTKFKVNAVCPGWTRTDFTSNQGTSSPQEAGQRIVKYAMIGDDGPTGKFISEEYFAEPASCPW
jgi:NAD(P)-dependent dehydrogenase (short-subunit alcohol dehydrogenase family)